MEQNKCIAQPKEGIVLNRMYAGEYLSSNLGHEVINMYRADNDNFYLYLNSHGNFAKCHKGKIGYMLLVKYHSKGIHEVVGAATGLTDVFDPDASVADKKMWEILEHQQKFIENENITYAGENILDIFDGSGYQNVFITYKAEMVWRRKSNQPLFIHFGTNEDSICETNVYIDKKQAKTSLKQYIYKETDEDDYTALLQKVFSTLPKNEKAKSDIWEPVSKVDKKNIVSQLVHKASIFDICQIQYSENSFSNALAYFMQQDAYRKLWATFFAQLYDGEDYIGTKLDSHFQVAREEEAKTNNKDYDRQTSGRIDLCIRDNKTLIMIENKIKSDINTIDSDKKKDDGQFDQLNRYWDYAKWKTEVNSEDDNKDKNKIIKAYILAPDYNIPKLNDKNCKNWRIIKYSDLYHFLQTFRCVFENDVNFIYFFEALKLHTFSNINDILYYEMQEKFFNRIKTLNNKI